MHQFRGYPDLRLNRSSSSTETSLWPSFTDIMTVILMVFMLTMVVVIIKNADLIDQIRLSRQLQAEADSWLVRYNTRRCNHSDFTRGRTPKQLLDNHHHQTAS